MASFDKFTERARKVLSLAQEEAQSFQHNYIGTEHLLLGLVREGEGVAAKVLSNLGVELNKVRSAVEFIIGRGDRIVVGDIGLTPRAKKVIEFAVDEARLLNHHYIGTEHLLLGLVREGEGIAAGVLESLGVNLEKVRTQTIQVLSQAGSTLKREEAVDPLSEQAKQTIALASEEARYFRHTMVRTEHLLAGLVRQNDSDAIKVLRRLGVNLVSVHDSIEFALGYGTENIVDGPVLSPMAKEVIKSADQEARALKQQKVMPVHILLALIGHEESIGAGLLEILVGNLAPVRAQILLGRSSNSDGSQPQVVGQKLALPWRTEEEIDDRRQQYLIQCLNVALASSDRDTIAVHLKEAFADLEKTLREKEQMIVSQKYEAAATLREHEVLLREYISRLETSWSSGQQIVQEAIYPFKGIKLHRADVEWLLIAHEDGCGPVEWRNMSQRGRVGLDLRGADLRGADLHGLPLAHLLGGKLWTAAAGIHLEDADLRGAHLEGANLFWAHLERSNLTGAFLQEANLTAAHLQRANLAGAMLQGANLSEAHLEQANLATAQLAGANLSWTYLAGATLDKIHLTEAKFLQPSLQEEVTLSETQ